MALLNATDESRVWRGLMRFWSSPDTRESIACTKPELLAAVQAINTYLDGAASARPATSINAAFPAATQSGGHALTTAQKGQMVAAIALGQTGNITLLRRMLGEVD